MSTTHFLKIAPNYLDAIKSGEKTFEVRRDDRGFQTGDLLVLKRYGRVGAVYEYLTEENCRAIKGADVDNITCRITWILTGGQLGIEPGYVVMSIEPIGTPDKGEE